MPRSPESSKPRFVFSAGCLFILLVTAVQVWCAHERSTDSCRSTRFPTVDTNVAVAGASLSQYTAEIRAESVLAESSLPNLLREASAAPPVAERVAPRGPVAMELPELIEESRDPWLESTDDFELPVVMGDTSVVSMFPMANVQSVPLPEPQRQALDLRRTIMAELPVHLSHATTIAIPETPELTSADALTPFVNASDAGVDVIQKNHELVAPAEPNLAAGKATGMSEIPRPISNSLMPADLPEKATVKLADSPPPVQPSRQESAFAQPVALLKAAAELSDPASKAWAELVKTNIERLRRSPTIDGLQAHQPLSELRELEQQVSEIVASIPNRDEQSRLSVTGYALSRRLAVYDAVRKASHPQIDTHVRWVQANRDDEQLLQIVDMIRSRLGAGQSAEPWIDFLRLEDLQGLAQSTEDAHLHDRAAVATLVLDRIASDDLTEQQQRLLQSQPFDQLQQALRVWATLPTDYRRLIVDLERFESNPSVLTGEALSRTFSQLNWSLVPQQNEVGLTLVSHYRNANVRVTMTERFMNRMLPVMKDVRTPVREQILGARVFGNSASWTRVAVGLNPDPHRINLVLLANGFVAADTRAFKGPVVVFGRNQSEFFLRKPIIGSHEGIYIGRSNTVAKASTNVLGLRTNYDNYPLIGSMVRRAAQQKVFEQRHLARRIFESRVADNAQDNIDSSVTAQLAKIERQLEEKIVAPLRRMQLHPQALDMRTTKERIVFRGRLSGDHQLAAYTARPNALAGNLVSMQFHESSLNNMIQQFQLDGREGNLRSLLAQLSTRVRGFSSDLTEEVSEDVEIELASHDALRVYLEDGHVRCTLRIARLSTARRDWQDFAVSANYTPNSRGFQIELSREGVVELAGRRLSLRDQIALRAIFGVVFSKNRHLNMVHPALASDSRLNDLAFSQVIIRDGWIGLSLDDEQARVARQREMDASDSLLR